MTYEEKDAAKRKAYQELTDTLSHDQMQMLNVILDASDVCPTCCNTCNAPGTHGALQREGFPLSFLAAVPAFYPPCGQLCTQPHNADGKRGPLPEKKEETPRVVEHHVFRAHCKCCNTLYEYQGKDIQTIELGMSRLSRRVAKGIHCTECNTFIEHKPVPYWLPPAPVRE
jgi:hypothetical protein